MLERRVGADIGRVLAAEFEPDADEGPGRGALDLAPCLDRAGEGDMVDAARGDELGRLGMVEGQGLKQPRRQAGRVEGFLETIADQQGLRGVLEENRVARHQRGDDRIDGGEIGIVPGRDGQDKAERRALDRSLKALFLWELNVGERLVGDRDHIARPFGEASQLAAAVTHRAAHLDAEFRRDLGFHRQHRVDCGGAQPRPFVQRRMRPFALRGSRVFEAPGDMGVARAHAANHFAAVDRRNADDVAHQMISK